MTHPSQKVSLSSLLETAHTLSLTQSIPEEYFKDDFKLNPSFFQMKDHNEFN